MDDSELELKQLFLDEAAQSVLDMEQAVIILEGKPADSPEVDKIFRIAHSLKGSGRAVGFNEMGEFLHALESLLLRIKNNEITTSSAVISLLLQSCDHLTAWVETLKSNMSASVDCSDLMALVTHFSLVAQSVAEIVESKIDENTAKPPESSTLTPTSETGEAEKQQGGNSEVQKVGSPVSTNAPGGKSGGAAPKKEVPRYKEKSNERVGGWNFGAGSKDPNRAATPNGTTKPDESIRVSLKSVDTLMNYVGELVIFQTVMTQHKDQIESQLLQKTVGQLAKITKDIQSLSMNLRMVPLTGLFQKLQRVARDATQTLQKKINLEISGGDTGIDKTVADCLGDPLVHLLRNAIDHGIEDAATRKSTGKSPDGLVTLSAFQRGGKIVIEIKDDGRGLNPDILKRKAIEKGLLHPTQVLTDREAQKLIFHPGFSTKTEVTEISGRGVGMDVVKTNIEDLQGEIEIDSVVGEGSCFRILLPLTLAIIDGMVVKVGEEKYILPTSHVFESTQPDKTQIHNITGMQPVLALRGESLPLFYLGDVLKRGIKRKDAWESTALVMRLGSRPFALQVDTIIAQQQVVIKQLGLEVRNTPGLSGAAILGDGRVAAILEMADLVEVTQSLQTGAA